LRDITSLVTLAVTFVFLAGCDHTAHPGGSIGVATTSAPPAEGAGQAQSGPARLLVDGFESGSIADFWLPGTYGTGLYVPGAVVVSKDYARSGVWSARITVKEGDVEQRGDDGRRVERAELDSGHYPLLGRDVWYGFSFLFPPTFPIVDNRLVIASWKQSDVEGSPLIGQRFRDGDHSLTIRRPGAAGSGKSYHLPDIHLGRWTDMVYRVRYSSGKEGRIEVWMNGTRVVSYEGPTASKEGADRFYNKIGLYRDRWKTPMTMYVDNYTLGDSFDRVDPSKFDRRP
jgi:Polysaccharide lyase